MNIKYFAAAFILGISMLSLSSYAADTAQNKADSTMTATAPARQHMRHRRNISKINSEFFDQKIEFFKKFRDSEAELFVSLKGLDKTEAESKIEDFYTEAFTNIPTRKNKGVNRIISSVEELEIPAETKAIVIEKIKTTNTAPRIKLQQKAIEFAKSLIDLPSEEREEAISDYNKWIGRHIINMGRRGHGMHHGMNPMRRGMNRNMSRPPHAHRMPPQCMNREFNRENDNPQHHMYKPHHGRGMFQQSMNKPTQGDIKVFCMKCNMNFDKPRHFRGDNYDNARYCDRMQHDRFKTPEQESQPQDYLDYTDNAEDQPEQPE